MDDAVTLATWIERMLTDHKRELALYAMHRVFVEARLMAYENAPQEKIARFERAGVPVAKVPSDIPRLVQAALERGRPKLRVVAGGAGAAAARKKAAPKKRAASRPAAKSAAKSAAKRGAAKKKRTGARPAARRGARSARAKSRH